MNLYNVTIKVDHTIVAEWVSWMKDEHMAELVATGLFTDYRLCRLLEHDDEEGATFSAQYVCNSLDDYNTYIEQHATGMRDKMFRLFGNKTIAFRTIMEIL